MHRIPWCVVLMMVNDQGRMKKKEDVDNEDDVNDGDVIGSEDEELEFLGLK